MIRIDLECPNCGGSLELSNNKKKCICPYCNSEFVVYQKMNEQLETVKNFCLNYENIDSCIIAAENIKETKIYDKARKHFGIPEEDDVFLICDLTFWETCRRGFAICTSGFYCRGKGVKKSKSFSWEEFKTLSIYAKNALIVEDVCFITRDNLTANLEKLLKKIQRIVWNN